MKVSTTNKWGRSSQTKILEAKISPYQTCAKVIVDLWLRIQPSKYWMFIIKCLRCSKWLKNSAPCRTVPMILIMVAFKLQVAHYMEESLKRFSRRQLCKVMAEETSKYALSNKQWVPLHKKMSCNKHLETNKHLRIQWKIMLRCSLCNNVACQMHSSTSRLLWITIRWVLLVDSGITERAPSIRRKNHLAALVHPCHENNTNLNQIFQQIFHEVFPVMRNKWQEIFFHEMKELQKYANYSNWFTKNTKLLTLLKNKYE